MSLKRSREKVIVEYFPRFGMNAGDVRGDVKIKDLSRYNQFQQEYFSRTIKRTIWPERTSYVLRHLEALVSFGDLKQGERILEVGCGMGRYTFLLKEKGFMVEGLELSPFLIKQMKRIDGGRFNIPIYQADIHHCPESLNGRYDALVGFFVLHHFGNLQKAFCSMASLLRPRGRVVFLEPNPYNFLYYIQILITPKMSWKAEKGLIHLRRSTIFSALKKAGFKGMKMRRFGFFPPFLYNHIQMAWIEKILERITFLKPFLAFQLFRGDFI